MPNKPTSASELLQNIPDELRQPPLWLQYYLAPSKPGKKLTKHPTVKYATLADKEANCRSLDNLLTRPQTAGGGFQRVVEKSEGLVYIDLDHCRDRESGAVEPWAQALVEELDSWAEVSASGEGIHIVCRGMLPRDFHVHPNKVEIYSGNTPNKLIAMTGNLLDTVIANRIEGRQERLEKLLERLEEETDTTPVEQRKKLIPEHAWRDVFHTGNELDDGSSVGFIEGILDEGVTFFGAHSDTGKTWIGLSVAHALLSQQPLFGVFPVHRKANVLYLIPEMGQGKFKARLKKMRISMDGGFYCQTVRDGAISLDDPTLAHAVQITNPVVILDTAIRFQAGDENSSTEQAQGLGSKMHSLIRKGALAVVAMHHRKKENDEEPSLQNTLRGSGDFGAMADCVWCVEHAKKKNAKGHFDKAYEEESKLLTRLWLKNVKPRDMDPADPFTIQGRPYIDQKGDFVVIDTHAEEGAPANDDPEDVAKILNLVKEQPSVGLGKIFKLTGIGSERAKRILDENKLTKIGGLWKRAESNLDAGVIHTE